MVPDFLDNKLVGGFTEKIRDVICVCDIINSQKAIVL